LPHFKEKGKKKEKKRKETDAQGRCDRIGKEAEKNVKKKQTKEVRRRSVPANLTTTSAFGRSFDLRDGSRSLRPIKINDRRFASQHRTLFFCFAYFFLDPSRLQRRRCRCQKRPIKNWKTVSR